MSRYVIEELVGFVSGLELSRDDRQEDRTLTVFLEGTDKYGNYTLRDWMNNGFMGWDPGLETYFLQGPCHYDQATDSEAPMGWWGTRHREIESPFMLVAMLNWIFEDSCCRITPRTDTLSVLIKDRRAASIEEYISGYSLEEVLGHFLSVDELWCTQRDFRALDAEYMQNGLGV